MGNDKGKIKMNHTLKSRLQDDEKGWTKLDAADPITAETNHPFEEWIRGYFNSEEHLRTTGFEFRVNNIQESDLQNFFANVIELRSAGKDYGYAFFMGTTGNVRACDNSRALLERDYALMARHTIKSFSDSTIPLAGIYWESGEKMWGQHKK